MGSGGDKTVYKTQKLDPPEPLPSHSAADVTPVRPTAANQSRVEGTSLLTPDDEEKRNTNLIG